MKKLENKKYHLHSYYGSDKSTSTPVRIILSKSGQPELKERKKKKGMYALGSN